MNAKISKSTVKLKVTGYSYLSARGRRERVWWTRLLLCERETRVKRVSYPGKSFGLIPNQSDLFRNLYPNPSDLFRNLYPSQSEPIRVNPKKIFKLVWCKSVENQSDLIWDFESEWIQTIFESRWIRGRNYSDWEFSLNHSDLGFFRIKNFFRIDSDWKSRIKSDWILVRIKNLGLNRMSSDWHGYRFRNESE